MAVSKYETHVKPKLFLIECWARDGVIDEEEIDDDYGDGFDDYDYDKGLFDVD
jgi:hypothetical protein